jgi:hypothetical protein
MEYEETQPLYNTNLNGDVERLQKKTLYYQIGVILLGILVILLGLTSLILLIYFTTPVSLPFDETVKPQNILNHIKVLEQIAFNHSGR